MAATATKNAGVACAAPAQPNVSTDVLKSGASTSSKFSPSISQPPHVRRTSKSVILVIPQFYCLTSDDTSAWVEEHWLTKLAKTREPSARPSHRGVDR